ncbi:Ribonuclease H [Desulfosudis oleivorans Hxd3]|uniref:ribonuclease H n=2 Tax=Desulfosudis TaxID=2904716 RepID=A8ZXF3_DESOH|nr:Ribonuclease H [Desulfosudis oleivorans Hxd3]
MYKKFQSRQEAEEFIRNPTYKTASKIKKAIQTSEPPVPKNAIIVYTDGSAIGNPGPGGYGVVIKGGKEISGGYKLTTNNRMELMAVIVALRELQDDDERPIVIYSDSKYVVDSINKGWVLGWKENKWAVTNGTRVNSDLWKKFLRLRSKVDVEFRWVKGHATDPLNIKADQLANSAARQKRLSHDKGYDERE